LTVRGVQYLGSNPGADPVGEREEGVIHRKSLSMALVAAWLTAGLAAGLAAGTASAQQSIAGATSFESPIPFFKDLKPWDPAYRAPRTADGKPDLQGVWTTASLTTMTRGGPGGLQRSGGGNIYDSLIIPTERVEQLTRNSYYNQRLANDQRPTDPNAPGGDGRGGGDVKGYNNFWIDPGSEYAKINGQYRSSWIVKPENGQIPFTGEGRKVRASRMAMVREIPNTGPEIRTLGDRCLTSFASSAGPPLNNAMYNNHVQIVQTPDRVLLNIEMNHDVRILRIAGAEPSTAALPSEMRRWFGDSVARWEGDSLVVETRNINPLQERAGAFPLSEKGRVTERFTRKSDVELFYEFTVEDPVYYAEAWSGEMLMRRSSERVYEYACHEGNYALAGILRGDAEDRDTAIDQEGE
jgi:hypothetical protein